MLYGIQPGQLVLALRVDQLNAPVFMPKQAAHFLSHGMPGCLVFNDQLVHLHAAACLGHLGHKVMKLQALSPAIHQHHARVLLAIGPLDIATGFGLGSLGHHITREDAPDRHGAEVAFGLGGVGSVQAGDHIVHGRVGILVPKLPPVALDDTATGRLRPLLKLPG